MMLIKEIEESMMLGGGNAQMLGKWDLTLDILRHFFIRI